MYKIGVSNVGEKLCEELIKEYSEAGLEYIEISCSKEQLDTLDFNSLSEWLKKYGVKIWSFHLPFMPFEVLDISSEEIASATLEYLFALMKKANGIGADKFIVHPSGEPIADGERPKKMETAKKSLFALAQEAKKLNATICVETVPRSCLGNCSGEMLELISAHPDLRVCFDTNHLLCEDTAEFIKKVGKKIVTLHVSDYDFVNERHWLPGEGKIDWQSVLAALKEINYEGIWLYEVEFEIPKTIIRPRRLTLCDLTQNAKELFENKEITLISTPKKNLGYWE